MKEEVLSSFISSPEFQGFFMTDYELFRMVIGIVAILAALFYSIRKFFGHHKFFNARTVASIGIFSGISALLYVVPYLSFSLPFFPSFLEIHFDEIFALIAGFAYGPMSGFMVILIKTLIKLPFTSTLCVGELADFIYGSILVVISSLIYKKHRNIKGAIVGLVISTVVQLIVSGFFTTFVMLDFYIFVMGFSEEAIISMCQAVNSNVTNLGWDFYLWVALPFNAFKDVIIIILTFLLYKKSHRLIDRIADYQTEKN